MSAETTNTIRVAVSFMILFFSILCHEFIAEPIIESYAKAYGDIDAHAGYRALGIVYLFNTMSCVVAAPIIDAITGKWAMVIGILTSIAFQSIFLRINETVLYIAAAMMGLGTTLLWVGQGQYITQNCSDENIEKNTAIQWALFKLSLIFGGIFLVLFFGSTTMEEATQGNMASSF
ncbi:unnamed protein product [Caenorhabditis bovis]|uniref:Uncharacterized protein n=1 Tax=Caenorhabditis bovis TaxID=2654633 RepID=A0A8S1ET34_9PELO|nr:unnamed protein product [Caenorhabditis bovis]